MASLDFQIRELKWEDAFDVIRNYLSLVDELSVNLWLGVTTPLQKPDLPYEVKWFADLYSSVLQGNAVAYVAEADERVVGMCEVRRRSSRAEFCHIGSLGLYVNKEYRGKGIGKALLLRTIQACKGKFEILTLEVFSNNLYAKRLYEKLGFRIY